MAATGHHEADDYNMSYPEPPHFSSAPMDLGLSPEPYSAYSRSSHEFPTTIGYEHGAIYTADTPYLYSHNGNHERSSPGMYPDDSDLRGPASDLSIASASSSNAGSPNSSHGQMAPIPEWATGPHGLGVTPGIVDASDFHLPGSEYSYAPGVYGDEYSTAFEYPSGKTPGFVGELSQIPRSSSCLSSRRDWSPRHQTHGSCASISSSDSCDSGSTIVAPKVPGAASSCLAVDTRLAQSVVTTSSTFNVTPSFSAASASSCPSSAASGLVFASPASSTSSFSSPQLPAWSSPPLGDSPAARPKTPTNRLLSSPFFAQSSGHFVPPLQNSCWFPLSQTQILTLGGLANPKRLPVADPILIHPDARPMTMSGFEQQPYSAQPNSAYPASPALSASPQLRNGSTSPFMHNNYQYSPYPPPVEAQRRPSLVSFHSNYSGEQQYSGDEFKEKQRCPHPECGKVFKDLKAHMLTHQEERPEKCPITTCEYHVKGFARK